MGRLMLLLLWKVLAVHASYAQTGSLQGQVSMADGRPAPNVNVELKGTGKGTSTDRDGHYEIQNIPGGHYTLILSFVGLRKREVPVIVLAGQVTEVPPVALEADSAELREVLVKGLHDGPYTVKEPSRSLRINTPLVQTPQNIQVITREVITSQQSFDMLEGIQRNVSGAQKVASWDNYARITMRGSQLTAFRNGMNVQMPWGPLAEDMSMVERIEFVKGPASFMLAGGEPGGFYNVVTKKPTGVPQGEATIALGRFDTYRATADIDGRFSENGRLLYRLNLMGQLKGSHRDFEYTNRYSITPVLRYLLDEQSSLTLEYTHQYLQMSVIGSNYAFSSRRYGDLPASFTTAEPNLEPTTIKENNLQGTFEHRFSDRWQFTAQAAIIHYDQVGQSLWMLGFSPNDSLLQRRISIWDALGINKTGQMFVNGFARTGGITHTLLGGIDMSHKDYYADFIQGAPLGDSTFNVYDPIYGQVPAFALPRWDRTLDVRVRGARYNTSYQALYVQDELGLFDNKLRLTIGGRYTSTKNVEPYLGNTDDGKFTPRAGVSVSLGENASAYALYDQAFLPNPGFDWQGNGFDPITGNNLEAGLKKDWSDGRWNTALSVYQITKNNVLTTDLEHPESTTGQFVYSRQTGQQQVKGIEVDLRGELAPKLSAVINYAYTDAIITRDADATVVGSRIPGGAVHIHNAWLNYRIGTGEFNGLLLSLGYQYQAGRSSWFIFDDSDASLPDYFRLDGGIAYHNDRFQANLVVNNLLNDYLYSGTPFAGTFYWQTEPLLDVRLTVGYRF